MNHQLRGLGNTLIILLAILLVCILVLAGMFYYRSYTVNHPASSAQDTSAHQEPAPLPKTKTYVAPDGSTSTVTCDTGISPEMEQGWLTALKDGQVTDNPDGSRTYKKDDYSITVTSSVPVDAETQRDSVVSAMTSGVTR